MKMNVKTSLKDKNYKVEKKKKKSKKIHIYAYSERKNVQHF